MQDHKQLAKGVLVNTLGVIAKGSRALYLIVFSRMLGSELFGLYMLAFALQEVVSKVAVLGLDQGAMRLVSSYWAKEKRSQVRAAIEKTLIVCIIVSSLVALAFGFSATWIANALIHKPMLASPMRNWAFGMPAVCATSVVLFAIRPSLRMQYEVYVRSLVEPLIVLVLGTLALRAKLGVNGIVFAHNLAAFLSLAMALFFFIRIFPKSDEKQERVDWKLLLNSSLPMGGMELLSMFKLRLDVMVLGRLLPLSAVGVYGAAVEIASILRKTRSAFEPVLLPIVQMLHERKEIKRFNENLALALRWVMVPSFALIGPMLLIPGAFLHVFGENFETGALSLSIFAIGQLFHVTLGLLEGVMAVTGFAYVTLVNSVTLVVGNTFLLLLCVPRWGLPGAAAAATVSFMAVTLWRLAQAKRLLKTWPFDRSQLKPLASFLGALAVLALLRALIEPSSFGEEVGLGLGFLALYSIGILAFRLEETDQAVLGAVRRKLPRKRAPR
jgi:O-antigen/teichoic acid export membrane protein